tara:strand:+ start:65 stop:535 length:471 start_codon:yes stop_codon:yes gene_type:complete
MKLLLENWRKFLTEAELYGNCGMVAIAMVEEAMRRGIKDVSIILVHDAPDYETKDQDLIKIPGRLGHEGEYDIAHVVVKIGNRYFDDRGEITKDQITVIDGVDMLDPHMAEKFIVETFVLSKAIEKAIERNTDHSKCPLDFKERASHLLDNAGYLS